MEAQHESKLISPETKFDQAWENDWRSLFKLAGNDQGAAKTAARRLGRHFWPDDEKAGAFNSVLGMINKLRDEKCFINDALRAWVRSGAKSETITWTLASMKVQPPVPMAIAPPIELGVKRQRSSSADDTSGDEDDQLGNLFSGGPGGGGAPLHTSERLSILYFGYIATVLFTSM